MVRDGSWAAVRGSWVAAPGSCSRWPRCTNAFAVAGRRWTGVGSWATVVVEHCKRSPGIRSHGCSPWTAVVVAVADRRCTGWDGTEVAVVVAVVVVVRVAGSTRKCATDLARFVVD